jgi:sucrose-6F-phosphate phosphohydrolase
MSAAIQKRQSEIMPMTKLLLCTDLDRTLLPNGEQPEHPSARPLFTKLCARPEVTLAYVSGRHLQLVEEAINEYRIPEPDFIISDVGTRIYQHDATSWQELSEWQELIAVDWQGNTPETIQREIGERPGLQQQEPEKQNSLKLSYYVTLPVDDNRELLHWIEKQLESLDVFFNLVWSINETTGLGLLDVIPLSASKLHAIEFLQRHLDDPALQTVFAGDSGNDLPVLTSEIPAVLVANATNELKRQAEQQAAANGYGDALLLAQAEHPPLGGNYSAGILQGVAYFAPQYVNWLRAEEELL